jgi:hypothetical protein
VLSSPIVIHMHRPYASEEEYLARERFSIEAKSMLLIDQPALPPDTAVVFDVTLDNGQKPIRAEAKVVGYVEPVGDRPGGLRVRFRRFGAATKAFIDRAVNGTPAPTVTEASPAASARAIDAAPPSGVDVPPPSAADAAAVAIAHPTLPSRVDAAPPVAPLSDARLEPNPSALPNPTPASHPGPEGNETDEASGIHKKTSLPYVAAPANREALLARLRGRRVG